MIRVIKESKTFRVSIGDIVSLKKTAFQTEVPKNLIKEHHMFVVVNKNPLVVCPISSNTTKVGKHYPYNIELEDWEQEGLYKPSHAKTDCSGVIENQDVYKLYGFLTTKDEMAVRSAYLEAPQKTILEGLVD